MFSKRLAGMVPEARKYVAASVALQWVALAANIALMLLMGAFVQSLVEGGDVAAARANLVMAAAAAIVVRVCCLTLSQRMGQAAAAAAKRTVRKLVYDKLVRLGPSYSERVSTSEAVQVSVEGTEQLESYFGSYLPQLFYSVLAPLTLFACLAPLCFPAAVALLACVPLIPASIVAVWKIAKRAMGSYWDAYTDLGATFLENLQGLTTLKIYRVDADRHEAMNREAETFRQATMRLLRMQLNSVTVMDVFAYGGAAVGIVMALWQFSLGQAPFFAAFAVIFLAAEFFIPLRTLGSFFHTAMNGMAAADSMRRNPSAARASSKPIASPLHAAAWGIPTMASAPCFPTWISMRPPDRSRASSARAVRESRRWRASCRDATPDSRGRSKWAACRSRRRRAPRLRAPSRSFRSRVTCSRGACARTCC